MQTWNALFESVSSRKAASLRASADRTRFEQWCELAEDSVLETLGSIALSRSAELAARTGVRVDVSRTTTRRHQVDPARSRVLSLVLAGSRVDIYSTREPGESPSLHFATMRASKTARFPVMTSLPCALVVRRDDGTVGLLAARQPGEPALPRPVTTYDTIVFRAFELLLGSARSALHAVS